MASSSSSSAIEQAILKEYNIRLPEGARISKTGEEFAKMSPTATATAIQAVLNEDLRDLFEPAIQKAKDSKIPVNVISCLPRDLPNARSATTPNPSLVQILSTRDATMPLRACGDLFEGEVPAGMTCTRNSTTRLLRLIVTDGVTEIPCLELSTLPMFSKKLPIPGEKLLLKGAQVKNGMVILEESTVKCVGGNASALFDEYKMMTLAVQNRNAIIQTDAPKFASLLAEMSNNPKANSGNNNSNNNRRQNNNNNAANNNAMAAPKPNSHQQQNKNQNQRQQQQRHQDPNVAASSHQHAPAPRGGGRGGGRGGAGRGGGNENTNDNHHQPQQQNRGGRGGGRGGNQQQPQHHHHHQHQHQGGRGAGGGRGGGGGGGRGGGYHQQHQHQHQHQRPQQQGGQFDWSGGGGSNNNNQRQQHQQGNVDARQLHAACNAGLEDLGY